MRFKSIQWNWGKRNQATNKGTGYKLEIHTQINLQEILT